MNRTRELITQDSFRKNCKEIHTVCVIIQGLAYGALILLSVGLIGMISDKAGRSEISDTAIYIIKALTAALSMNFITAIFKKLGSEHSPFTYEIADKIKGATHIIEMGGLMYTIMVIIFLITSFSSNVDFSFTFTAVFIAALLHGLAYIFDYGAQLQKESDETL